jgi:GAF domain-containing protein
MRVQEVFDFADRKGAMGFLLDLAMEKVPCESGSVYRADISSRDMSFAAARGPKADELLAMDPRIPVGTGLAGFTVEEGVALAISDAHRDPRFFKTISEKLGYECRSIITVPVQLEGQVMGAIQLINRKSGTTFGEADLSILNYLAHEAGEYLRRTGDVTV